MRMLADALVGLVALLHLYFLVLEMFLWTRPLGLKVFRNTPEKAEITKVLAANQGLYNGFLVAGLVWGLYLGTGGRELLVEVGLLQADPDARTNAVGVVFPGTAEHAHGA